MEDPTLQRPFASPQNMTDPHLNANHHIITGSFRSLSLFLLAFSPSTNSLKKVKKISGNFGPHQYLAKIDYLHGADDKSGERKAKEVRVFGTSWALPPMLCSWGLAKEDDGDWKAWDVGRTPITAVSSYVNIPYPYTYIYSTGGPTGEIHRLDEKTGGFGEKVQEVFFVKEDELEAADKTLEAILLEQRYGSHAIEFTPDLRFGFVPVLGTNTIEMYSHDPTSGRLTHMSSIPSPRQGVKDGPRHVKIHPNGKILYCVAEHTNMVDAYRIVSAGLEYVNSQSLLPDHLAFSTSSVHQFRGDTLMFSPFSPKYLVTTTRGSHKTGVRGWLSIFALNTEGEFDQETKDGERFETPTSGGKANAIDLLSKGAGEGFWILLTDDDESIWTENGTGRGAVRVLEWNGFGTGGVRVVAEWPGRGGPQEEIKGGSHAIWLD